MISDKKICLSNSLLQWTIILFVTILCLVTSDSQARSDYYEKKTDQKKIITPKGLSLQFSATGTSTRTIDPIPNRARQKWVSIGIVAGDTVTLTASLNPHQSLPAASYVWSGAASRIGPSINLTFNTPGTYTQTVTVKGNKRTARITVVEISGISAKAWGIFHPRVMVRAKSYGENAAAWALNSPEIWGQHNGTTDAGRHMLWNALMVVDPFIGSANAATISTGYEVDEVNSHPHNECVMDMLNNAIGLSLGAANPGASASMLQSSVVTAINNGAGTILDGAKPRDGGNAGNVGLLLPSNK